MQKRFSMESVFLLQFSLLLVLFGYHWCCCFFGERHKNSFCFLFPFFLQFFFSSFSARKKIYLCLLLFFHYHCAFFLMGRRKYVRKTPAKERPTLIQSSFSFTFHRQSAVENRLLNGVYFLLLESLLLLVVVPNLHRGGWVVDVWNIYKKGLH